MSELKPCECGGKHGAYLIRSPTTSIWFTCDRAEVKDSNVRQGRQVICLPDGLRIITEYGKYVGFYTQNPCDK